MAQKDFITQLLEEEAILSERLSGVRNLIKAYKVDALKDEPKATQSSEKKKDVIRPFYQGYNINASFREKLSTIFKNENKFINMKQIIDKIGSVEGLNEDNKEKLRTSVLPAISLLKSKGVLTTYKVHNMNKNTFYGSPKWLNDDGTVKTEHMYDESLVTEIPTYEI